MKSIREWTTLLLYLSLAAVLLAWLAFAPDEALRSRFDEDA